MNSWTGKFYGLVAPPRTALLIIAAVLPGFALFLWHASRYGNWLVDDAGITFAYARDLAAGLGLVSQPGVEPVEGFSNPLWTLLIALLYFLKLFSIPFTPKLLGCCLVFGSFVAFAAAVARFIEQPDAAVVAGAGLLLTAANPGFVIWCVSGLENPLLVFAAACLLFAALGVLKDGLGERELLQGCVRAGLFSAALALTRPDGLIYSALFPLALFLRSETAVQNRAAIKPLFVYALCVAVPYLTYLLFRHFYFHDWVPNTYYPKWTGGGNLYGVFDVLQLWGPGADRIRELFCAIMPVLPVLLPITLLGTFTYFISRPKSSTARCLLLLGCFVALPCMDYALLPADWMGEYRFATPAFPASYLLVLLVLRQMIMRHTRALVRHVTLVCTSIAGLAVGFPALAQRDAMFLHHVPMALEDVTRQALNLNALAESLHIRNGTVLLPDLGGTLLASHLRAVDIEGLCDRHIARLIYERRPTEEMAAYLLRQVRPDFVEVHGVAAWRSGLLKNPEFIADYLHLGGTYYVRRASLPPDMDGAAARIAQTLWERKSVSEDVRTFLRDRAGTESVWLEGLKAESPARSSTPVGQFKIPPLDGGGTG